jgi:predicted RNA binding protein YcfA (HicA-like mRNA interferase family)
MISEFIERDRKFLESLLGAHGKAPYRDVVRMFQMAGYNLDRVKGSHHIFVPVTGPGPTLTVPVHGQSVKAVYLKRVIKILFPDI